MYIRIETNLDTIQSRLREAGNLFSDLRPFWQEHAVDAASEETQEVFESEGRGLWPGLNPRYAAEKAVLFPGKGILRATDAYFDAATQPNAAGNLIEIGADTFTYGVAGSFFEGRAGDNYPLRHETGEGVQRREVFGLAVRPLSERLGRLLDVWAAEELRGLGFLQRR